MALPPLHLDLDAHGRVTPKDDEARRALADRAGRFLLLPSAADLLLARRTPAAGGASQRPRCVLAGDLSGFPIVDFVAFIQQSRLSGVLTVVADGAERTVTFKDGEVRAASSSNPSERLGEIAIRLGFATSSKVTAAQASGQPMGRALVSGGHIAAAHLSKCVHEQVATIFQAILLARDGHFLLVDEDISERPGSALSVNTQSLLMDGIRRIDEMSLFRAKIPGPTTVLRRREPRRTVPLNAGEQALLALVDGLRTIAELSALAHLNEFDVTKTLFHLAEAGYVENTGAAGAGSGRLETVVEAMGELLQLVTATVPDGERGTFLDDIRAFLADPAAVHAPLWLGLTVADDGAIDSAALVARLAALPPPVLQRLQPSGDRRAVAAEALRELLYAYLYASGGRIERAEDDFLGAELKRRLETVDGPGA